jgi:hypothetical protein
MLPKRITHALLGRRGNQLLAEWQRRNAMIEQMNHRLALLELMNHRVADLEHQLGRFRYDAETVAALSLSFQRFAAELTDHLAELTDELTKQARDLGSSTTR